MAESGTIKYTERAFEQDADLAMGNDIMRALVELITNADDAYGGGPGSIKILVDRLGQESPSVSVSDTACGLSPEELKKCFSILGGQESGFQNGANVRGLFGRGAKDTAAFGTTTFQSIHNGTLGTFELSRNGKWELTHQPANDADYAELGIDFGCSGLVATICIEKNGVSLPVPARLVERIERHVQLRQINSEREVVVGEIQANKPRRTAIALWTDPPGDVLYDQTIQIPGYEKTARLVLSKLAIPAEGVVNDYSIHGIEVRGTKASYANTFFGENGPETSWIHGFVIAPEIDHLLRMYDSPDGDNPSNPTRLIRRDRNGLSSEHPYTTALSRAVLAVLSPILEDLKPKASKVGGGAKLKKDLESASSALSALIRSDLTTIDENEGSGGLNTTNASPIILIPPKLGVRVGQRRSLSVLIKNSLIEQSDQFSVSLNVEGVVQTGPLRELRQHANFAETSIGNLTIESLALGNAVITVAHVSTGESASGTIRVHDDDAVEPEPPVTLQWSSPVMSVASGKQRTIELLAPIDVAPTGTLKCEVSIVGDEVQLLDSQVELRLTADGWLSGRCRISGGSEGSSAVIRARDGDHEAEGKIRVTRPSALDGIGVRIEIVDESRGRVRAQVRHSDSGQVIEVCAKHPALANLLGERNPDGSYAREEERNARLVLAEIVASVIADWLVNKEAQKFPGELSDSDAVLGKRNLLVDRYISPLQRALAQEPK
jgi:hypothetical protein